MSSLKFDSVEPEGANVSLRFTAMGGRSYTIQYRDGVSAGVWLKLRDVPSEAATRAVEVDDSTMTGVRDRFYRLVTPTQP
jgi:hypothetical protein